jgi:hypothetical protein
MRKYRLTNGNRTAEVEAFSEMSARSKVALDDTSVPVGFWSWAANAELIICDDSIPYSDTDAINYSQEA